MHYVCDSTRWVLTRPSRVEVIRTLYSEVDAEHNTVCWRPSSIYSSLSLCLCVWRYHFASLSVKSRQCIGNVPRSYSTYTQSVKCLRPIIIQSIWKYLEVIGMVACIESRVIWDKLSILQTSCRTTVHRPQSIIYVLKVSYNHCRTMKLRPKKHVPSICASLNSLADIMYAFLYKIFHRYRQSMSKWVDYVIISVTWPNMTYEQRRRRDERKDGDD